MDNSKLIFLSVLIYSVALAGCGNNKEMSQRNKELLWIEKGKDAVRLKLKDADSAEFRNVYFKRGSDGVPVACGEVNSKNSFGGYSGYQQFISAGKPELTYLQEQASDFDTVWRRFCG